MTEQLPLALYFSQYFDFDPMVLQEYGAFDISLVSDLPLFIDPFLLFNSTKPEYQELHESIIRYLSFLRDKSVAGDINEGLLKNWYYFKEVRQNWFGFTYLGNGGHALGKDFADSLNANLGLLFADPGAASITEGRHLEKLSLIKQGVGRDSISDFVTNLIKKFLLEYTQAFTVAHIADSDRKQFRVSRVSFNYETESWVEGSYWLPVVNDDFVLLTPEDMLTRDETWINRSDLIRGFAEIPAAISDQELRSQVSNYFQRQLRPNPNQEERAAAAQATIERYPELLDYYIALKELSGERASTNSRELVSDALNVLVNQVKLLVTDLRSRTDILQKPLTSPDEARDKVLAFKRYVEDNDGYKVINRQGQPFSTEAEVHLFFGLALVGSVFDINHEPNNGRGAVDFKLSKGAFDKSLIEFKLGSNTQLKRNLEKQVEIYKKANRTSNAVKVIVNYTAEDEARVRGILRDLELSNSDDVIVIDARSDNKPSASKA